MISACGGDSASNPVATAPAPPPSAASVPVHRAQAWVLSQPGDGGYVQGSAIRVVAEFEERLSVTGSPRLGIEIGETVRYAGFSPWVEDDWPPERPTSRQRFDYVVRAEDRDANGISITADAFDFADGAFLDGNGVEVEVEIYSVTPTRTDQVVEPGRDLDAHRVFGIPLPEGCTYERDSALMFIGDGGGVVAEWDGTPIPVDYLPDFPNRQFILDELDEIEALADAIERQLGYRIVERGTILDDFVFPEGWREEPIDYREPRAVWLAAQAPLDQIPLRLDRVLAVHYARTFDGRCYEWALPWRAIIGFSTCAFADPSPIPGWPKRTAVLHELFHVFGFAHSEEAGNLGSREKEMLAAGIPLNRMSAQLDFVNQREGTGPRFTRNDIEALRCIFPPMSD